MQHTWAHRIDSNVSPENSDSASVQLLKNCQKKTLATIVSPIDHTPQSFMATGSGDVLTVLILGGGEGALPDVCCCVCKDFSGKNGFR